MVPPFSWCGLGTGSVHSIMVWSDDRSWSPLCHGVVLVHVIVTISSLCGLGRGYGHNTDKVGLRDSSQICHGLFWGHVMETALSGYSLGSIVIMVLSRKMSWSKQCPVVSRGQIMESWCDMDGSHKIVMVLSVERIWWKHGHAVIKTLSCLLLWPVLPLHFYDISFQQLHVTSDKVVTIRNTMEVLAMSSCHTVQTVKRSLNTSRLDCLFVSYLD